MCVYSCISQTGKNTSMRAIRVSGGKSVCCVSAAVVVVVVSGNLVWL